MRRKAQNLAKSTICVAFFSHLFAEGKFLLPMHGHPDSGLLVPCFKFAESGPCRGVEHYPAAFDLIHRLPAYADEFGQQRLRQASFSAQRPEAFCDFRFLPRSSVHFPCSLLVIVAQKRIRHAGIGPATPFSDLWRLFRY